MLLSVLTAALIFALGMLGFSYGYARFTAVISNDQFLRQMAPASNAFWGIVQANPGVLGTLSANCPCSYSATNYTGAPAALQDWLASLTTGSSALPGALIGIATGPDVVSGAGCSSTTGCTVTMTISWTQNPNAATGVTSAITRTQNFSYQFGL
jgi:hypothetical protein